MKTRSECVGSQGWLARCPSTSSSYASPAFQPPVPRLLCQMLSLRACARDGVVDACVPSHRPLTLGGNNR